MSMEDVDASGEPVDDASVVDAGINGPHELGNSEAALETGEDPF